MGNGSIIYYILGVVTWIVCFNESHTQYKNCQRSNISICFFFSGRSNNGNSGDSGCDHAGTVLYPVGPAVGHVGLKGQGGHALLSAGYDEDGSITFGRFVALLNLLVDP